MHSGLADEDRDYTVLLVGGSSRLHAVKQKLLDITRQVPEVPPPRPAPTPCTAAPRARPPPCIAG